MIMEYVVVDMRALSIEDSAFWGLWQSLYANYYEIVSNMLRSSSDAFRSVRNLSWSSSAFVFVSSHCLYSIRTFSLCSSWLLAVRFSADETADKDFPVCLAARHFPGCIIWSI